MDNQHNNQQTVNNEQQNQEKKDLQSQQKLKFQISKDRKNCFIDQLQSVQFIKCIHEIDTTHEEDIYCMTIIDDNFLVTGSIDQFMQVYQLQTLSKVYSLPGTGEAIQCLEAFRTSNKSLLLSSAFDQSILVYDLYYNPPKILIQLQGIGTELTIMQDLQDQEFIIAGSIAGHIGVWSMKVLKPVNIIENAHSQQVSSLKIVNYQNKEFISCSTDGTIKKWRLEASDNKGEHPKVIELFVWKEQQQIISINVIERGNSQYLIFGTQDGVLSIRSMDEKQELIDQSKQHDGEVNEILILQDSNKEKVFTVSTSHLDRFLLLNDLQNAKQKKIKNDNIYCFYFNVNSKIQFLKLKNNQLGLAMICQEQLNPMFLIFQVIIK